MRRRRRKRNPDAGTMLAGAGGFAVLPIPANALALVSGSRSVGAVGNLGVAALATWGALRASSPATSWALAGGAISSFLNAAVWLFVQPPVQSSMLHTTYQGEPAPAALPRFGEGLDAPRQWLAFQPASPLIPLVPGHRYRAAIDLPFGAGPFATADRVRSKAEELGFADVVISDGEGWVDPFGKVEDADLFVEATYAREPKWLERNERIVSAWAFT